jgi:hypothetical protein
MKKLCVSIICLTVSTSVVFPWGEEGHRAIALTAIASLDSGAATAVRKILAASTVAEISDIPSAATWPDDIRISTHPGKFVKTAGAKSFNARFPGNRVWHFVDFPLDADYSETSPFASTNDVVHILGHCILVLEGTPEPAWAKMKKEEALAWLIHLVGDLHQPLHVGVGFYNFIGNEAMLITDPNSVQGKFTDTGGNALHFGSSNFHSFWDDAMVQHVSTKETTVVTLLSATLDSQGFQNSGDFRAWPPGWATDTIHQAKAAYAGISEPNNSVGQRDSSNPQVIIISFNTADYKDVYLDTVKRQLGKAAFDLRDLLNHIHWQASDVARN